MPLDPILSGVAGQYLVAAELSRRGIIATVTLRNTRGVDVLAANVTGTKTVAIQVKTAQGSSPEWILSKAAETLIAQDLFYVFVNLNDDGGQPTFHVVESAEVADFVAKGHKAYLAGSKRGGGKRKDSSMRKFKDPNGKFLDGWKRLGLS